MFPSGRSGRTGKSADLATAQAQYGAPQYLPPQHHQNHHQQQHQQNFPPSGCNPCNDVPWIPVASNLGQKTVLNFIPNANHGGNNNNNNNNYNHGHGNLEDLKPPPYNNGNQNNQYLPPNNLIDQIPHKSVYKPQFIQKPQLPKIHYEPAVSPSEHSPQGIRDYMVPPPLITNSFNDNYNYKFKGSNNKPFNYNKHPPKLQNVHNKSPSTVLHKIPVTQLKPVQGPEYPLDVMRPPPFIQNQGAQQYPPSAPNNQFYQFPPLPNNDFTSGANQIFPPEAPLKLQPINYKQPIAFPNLNPEALAPIYNPQNFYGNQQNTQNIQVLPSVKVADYLSSIEHPVNVIQSPIFDLNVKDEPSDEPVNDQADYQKEHPVYTPDNTHGGQNEVNSGVQDNPMKTVNNVINLRENPIVVDDAHASATNLNENQSNQNKFVNVQASPNYNGNGLRINIQLPTKNYETTVQKDENHNNFNLLKQLLLQQENNNNVPESNETFTSPAMEYSKWHPSGIDNLSSMIPPPLGTKTWLHPVQSNYETTTTKTKPIQIIIPYVKENKPQKLIPYNNKNSYSNFGSPYTTLVPVYTPPSSSERSIWTNFIDSNSAESQSVRDYHSFATTPASNIREILENHNVGNYGSSSNRLPFDIVSLQKTIDHWTQQEYSNGVVENNRQQKKFPTSKKIPMEYFSTKAYSVTPRSVSNNINIEAASSSQKEVLHHSHSRVEATTPKTTTSTHKLATISAKYQTSLWNVANVTLAESSDEKIYVVTPSTPKRRNTTPTSAWSLSPKVENGQVQNKTKFAFLNPKFMIKIEDNETDSQERVKKGRDITVVFSEWPHLINNLQTTTSTQRPARHPLFGLMDVTPYTPPPNSTVHTISGHSRVTTVVTPSTLSTKETSGFSSILQALNDISMT